MMNYKTSYQSDKSFLSLTSLYPEEFDYLLPTFAQEWYKYYKHFDMLGKRRKAPKATYENDTKTLPKVEGKLFFILVYLKITHHKNLLHVVSKSIRVMHVVGLKY